MHPNPGFRKASKAQNIAFARDRGFGTLVLSTDGAPLVSHVPFLLDDRAGDVTFHLVRSNPIMRQVRDSQPATLAVTGPHSYISPDWYGVDDQVPTWNYVAVHLTGRLEPLPTDRLRAHLEALSQHFEAKLSPKPVWRIDKMTPEVFDRMQRQIVPFRLVIEQVEGTWKLNQNKEEDARLNAAHAVEKSPIGSGNSALAALMRDKGA